MAHAEALALHLGLAEVRPYINAMMAANVRLYGALGYGVDRREATSDGRTVVPMSKRLAP